MPTMPMPFNPDEGTDVSQWRLVYPDANDLVEADVLEHGPCDEFRIAKVPDVPVYILYGVQHGKRVIRIVCIRTHRGPVN